MRIAQVSPLFESVPPVRYGGRERIVSYLTEELVNMGHDVTLFASADSITNARLIPGCTKALGYDKQASDQFRTHIIMLENIIDLSPNFDIIHFHIDNLLYALTRHIKTPYITTHHDRIDISQAEDMYRKYKDIPVVSVSNAQRSLLPECNWQGTVYSGVAEKQYDFSARHQDYLVFLGDVSPEKGIIEAIEIARRADMQLKIAAKIDPADQAFFNTAVKPLLADPRIEFVGEINNTEKNYFLGDAYALLYPVKYPVPFGLVMVEAMACGVPIIAFRSGSVGEIVEHGVTGYIVDELDEAVEATALLERLSRKECHNRYLRQFTATRMANNYIDIYNKSIMNNQPQRPELAPERDWLALTASG